MAPKSSKPPEGEFHQLAARADNAFARGRTIWEEIQRNLAAVREFSDWPFRHLGGGGLDVEDTVPTFNHRPLSLIGNNRQNPNKP